MIDLHTHSTISDGSVSPAGLIAMAREAGLSAIALTDHDTTDGLAEFLQAGSQTSIKAIPGVEISCILDGLSLHLVGLFIEKDNSVLQRLLQTIRQGRQTRNLQILNSLNRLGHPITYEEVEALSGGGVIGRPHIAQALVQRGICSSIREAFDRFLGNRASACQPRYQPAPVEGIRAIHAAGGLAIWAHPLGFRFMTIDRVRQLASQLQTAGLDGIEFYYSEYSPEQERIVQEVGVELGLLASGGSDFHGATIPNTHLGVGKGNLRIPDELIPPLEAHAAKYRQSKS
jgi:predicted metal-dependent phosphoesterase TrpH